MHSLYLPSLLYEAPQSRNKTNSFIFPAPVVIQFFLLYLNENDTICGESNAFVLYTFRLFPRYSHLPILNVMQKFPLEFLDLYSQTSIADLNTMSEGL